MEPWQRWSMRGTENPENEVRVLGAPPEYMVSVARMEEHRVVAPVAKGSIPFRHTGLLIRGPEVQILLSPPLKGSMAERLKAHHC